ncbi:hypothetical protein D1872_267990 [compost metagenome]
MVFRDQTLNVFDDEVNQRPFGRRKLIAHARQDNVADLCFIDHFFQGVGEVGDNHNRRRTAVVQLVLQLAWCIERVDVDHDHARTQDPKKCYRILKQVWHHQRDAVPFLQP